MEFLVEFAMLLVINNRNRKVSFELNNGSVVDEKVMQENKKKK